MNIQTQNWLLNRRHVLRGLGASLALPLLNAMVPLRAQAGSGEGAEKPRRSVFVYIPNGVNGMKWQITKAGRNFEFSPSLKPLERHRENLTIFSGLHHPRCQGQAHVCADTWLTGARMESQSGGKYKNSVSCDQVIAEQVGLLTRFPSLELSIKAGTGRPYSSSTLAFSRDGVPLPAEDSPRRVFERLFGEPSGGVEDQRSRFAERRSVLDAVLGEANALKRDLGSEDRTKLDEYLHSVRDVEKRTARLEEWLDVPKPEVDPKVAARFRNEPPKSQAGEYWRTMFDLITLALRTDMTRVVTYMNGSEGNGLPIPEIDVTQSRHNISHHNGDPKIMDRFAKTDAFLMEQFAHFLDSLSEATEGGESLLDRTMVLCGSGMSYGHSHSNSNLPILFAGGGALGLRHGQHIDYNRPHLGENYEYVLDHAEWRMLCGKPKDERARLSNLFLTMQQKMGVENEAFIDSLGPISEVVA